MVTGGAVGLVAMASGRALLLVPGTLVAFALGWSWPGVFNLAVVNHHPHAPAAATGLTQTGSYAGGALGPLLMGALVQHDGYGPAWLTFATIALACAGVMLLARHLLAVPAGASVGGRRSCPSRWSPKCPRAPFTPLW